MGSYTLTVDLRWIDSSGIGTYIQGMMPGLVQRLGDISIVILGDGSRLGEFDWSRAANVRITDCQAARYSLAEQVRLPLAIPCETSLFFSPHYPIPLAYRGRLAVTVHDMSHLIVPEIVGNWKKRMYAQTMFRALRKRAAVIFTVSNFSKAELLRLTGQEHEERILTTHLGLSADWYQASGLPRVEPGPYLIYVGNIKPYKNLGRLVEAFLLIKDRVPHDLLIVGQSEGLITGESADFFERVRSAGGRIRLAGLVPRPKLLSLVGHASALVLPSLYEGFGLPPLEAMAAGTPAVVARTASLPEVCGDAALYFDPLVVSDIAEKLMTIVTNHALSEMLRQRGQQRSRQFSWQACAEATSNALRGAMLDEHG